ncbi:MAG: glycosyltransferase family 2 protein [Pseudomonadota bacterium]
MARDERDLRPASAIARRPRPRLTPADGGWTRGAARPPTLTQIAVGAGLAAALAASWTLWTEQTSAALQGAFFVLFVLVAATRLAAALTAREAGETRPLTVRDLPRYSVIVPLYREAAVVPGLLRALDALDYPRDRLQVLIVVEADDGETRQALAGRPLPAWVEVLAAPPGLPRTKPRACNIALEQADGELVVIYDAEDRPGPGQLREAAARFAAGPPRLACLQAPLRIEPDRRLLPAQFALEYAAQFEVLMPALARIGAPFPLGGTSNHFRAAVLRAVGGWDAWNVTEDADLGFRLAAEGYRMDVLECPTFEPAPDRLSVWLPQRSRWVKGYMQTFGVQSRDPPHWRTGAAAAFAVTLGAAIAASFLHGPLLAWTLVAAVLGLAEGVAWVRPSDAVLLAVGWLCAASAVVVGARRAGTPARARDLLLMPFYWPLQSLAAAHALHQLVFRPFHWDKTPHAARETPAADGSRAEPAAPVARRRAS